jgi:hypothetical protein
MPGCPATAPELLLRADGCVDVRCVAALAALVSCAGPWGPGGGVSSGSSSGQGPSSSSSSGSWQEEVARLVGVRCRGLLQQYPSSLQEDEAAAREGRCGEGLLAACLEYRLGKKRLLQAAAAQVGGS